MTLEIAKHYCWVRGDISVTSLYAFFSFCSFYSVFRKCASAVVIANFLIFAVIAFLSPVAVARNAQILVAIWIRSSIRTPLLYSLMWFGFYRLFIGLSCNSDFLHCNWGDFVTETRFSVLRDLRNHKASFIPVQHFHWRLTNLFKFNITIALDHRV